MSVLASLAGVSDVWFFPQKQLVYADGFYSYGDGGGGGYGYGINCGYGHCACGSGYGYGTDTSARKTVNQFYLGMSKKFPANVGRGNGCGDGYGDGYGGNLFR
jgi:hypothetical protein